MNKKLSKEELKWEDDSKVMKEKNKYVKYHEKMSQLDEKYNSNEITNEEYCNSLEELLKEISKI